MKPYFAVLYDSYQESVRSKVLWILLAAWTLILAALFPLSISPEESFAFTFADIQNPRLIFDNLAAASAGNGTRAHKAIYGKLDEDFQQVLVQRESNKRRINSGMLTTAFNKLLTNKELYSKEAWPTADRGKELKPLIESGASIRRNIGDDQHYSTIVHPKRKPLSTKKTRIAKQGATQAMKT